MPARNEEIAMLAKRTVEAMSPEMQEMAEELGVSYSSLKYWKSGERSPSPENLTKLADLADAKADELLALAGRIRRAVNDGGGES